MLDVVSRLTKKVVDGKNISYEEALQLLHIGDLEQESFNALLDGANQIRRKYCGKHVELCTIMNVKSGKCTEDCKFCSQSIHYNTSVDIYDLLDYETILKRAKKVEVSGALRFSLVTSGHSISSEGILEKLRNVRLSKDTNLKLCASHGVATTEELKKLKEAGVTMYHHNVETSANNYHEICTTHDYQERIDTIKNVQEAGLDICCSKNTCYLPLYYTKWIYTICRW